MGSTQSPVGESDTSAMAEQAANRGCFDEDGGRGPEFDDLRYDPSLSSSMTALVVPSGGEVARLHHMWCGPWQKTPRCG